MLIPAAYAACSARRRGARPRRARRRTAPRRRRRPGARRAAGCPRTARPVTAMRTTLVRARPEVPPQRRGEREDPEPAQVLPRGGAGHERQVALEPARERPEREVERDAVEQPGDRAVAGEQQQLPAGGDPRQQAGPQPDPGGAQHLVGQPRPDSSGDQGRGEQGRGAEDEPEAGAEHAAAEHEQEEDRLEPRGAGAQRTQGGTDGGEHPEHRHGLDVEAALADLEEHHGHEQGQQQGEDEGRVGVLAQP